jgi:uncharacterized protein YukJ
MPIPHYGVTRGRAVAARREDDEDSPHYQVHVIGDDVDFRLAVNVKSQAMPSELLFLVDANFRHPVLDGLSTLSDGFTPIESRPGGIALDFIRGNLFDRTAMQALPHNLPGPANDLNDQVQHYVARAIAGADAEVYVFGSRWGPEPTRDKIFRFRPGNGVHDIHMNQGNHARFKRDDGVWQDGAIIFHFEDTDQWVAIFLAFQSQAWHTDDTTGHAISDPGPTPGPEEPDGKLRIVAALVNPAGREEGRETVTLLNATATEVDLRGWRIADAQKRKHALQGTIAPGEALTVRLAPPVALSNAGGIITLLDDSGLKVHGVSYTKQQAAREGRTIVF